MILFLTHVTLTSMKAFCRLGFIGLALLSLSSYFGTLHPAFDMLANFRLQFCLALGFGLLLLFLLRCRFLLRAGLLLFAFEMLSVLSWYNKAQVIPPVYALPPVTNSRIKVLSANVLFDNHRSGPLQALIDKENPDLVVLQEANDDLLAMMGRYREQLPYHFRTRNLPYGLAVWSKLPILHPRFQLLGQGELPSLSGEIQLGSRRLSLFTTHLTSPIRRPALERNRQLRAMADYVRQHSDIDLILGDFNVAMWSPYYRAFEQASGFSNCRRGFGVLPSWPSQLPALARIPIDQCLTRGSVQVERMALGPNIGSDHLPVLLTLAD